MTYSPVRIMEDFLGQAIKEAGLSEPVGITGFNVIPEIGSGFQTVSTKKEAEAAILKNKTETKAEKFADTDLPVIPILIKADVKGTIDAIIHELKKFQSDRIAIRVIDTGVGAISGDDVQNVSATKDAIIVGFNVKVERAAKDAAERLGVEIDTFDIIYELSEWLNTALMNRTPKKEEAVMTGKFKILREFSVQKNIHVLGGRVDEGTVKVGQMVRILRRDIEIGKGKIKNVQQQKSDVKQVSEGEFGMQVDTKADVAPGDYMEAFDLVVT